MPIILNLDDYNILADSDLIRLLQIGDASAFTEIYNRYWAKLFAIAANKIKDLEEAEEIVQDIFVSLWKRHNTLGVIDTLSSYLAVSVKYKVIKTLEKQNNRQRYNAHLVNTTELKDDYTQEWLEFEELKSRLAVYVNDLPQKCRLVFQLSREEGYSHKKIAEKLEISEKTVEAHLNKAIKTLKTRLNNLLL